MASRRVEALARHLEVEDEVMDALQIYQTAAAADQERPLAGGGPGTITITDNRNGKQYNLVISEHGTFKATDLKKITNGGDNVGLRPYDNGYMNTTACVSRVSYIDGDKGILRYRGYPIEQLAEKSNFLETAYLVVYGHLPTTSQMSAWSDAVMRHSALPVAVENTIAALPHDAHPMGTILTGLCALSTLHPEQNPALAGQRIYDSKQVQDKQIVRLIGKMPALAALAYHRGSGRRPTEPNAGLGYAENLLFMLDAGASRHYRPNPRLARVLDVLFILHAEHELNCSTSAARHLTSSGVDVYTVAAGAVGALYGPLHGGANEAVLRMLERIGSLENVPAFLDGVKNRKERLFGFGHRVYKNYDPRATIIRGLADEVFRIAGRDPLIDVAMALEKAARSDDFFVSRKLYPNVDFYSGLVYRAMGFPPAFFTVLFAIPRIAGYLAHWREVLADPDTKIVRPQQDYRGVWLRDFQEASARPNTSLPDFEKLGPVPASNAFVRRAAGEGSG